MAVNKKLEVYKCSICGNVVEVLTAGGGELICCGQPMELLNEKKEDTGQEKHLPVITKTEKGFRVAVGSVLHPMEEDHYIEWIELVCGGLSYRKFLRPGDKPEAVFDIETEDKQVEARAYCNLHGLWKSKAD